MFFFLADGHTHMTDAQTFHTTFVSELFFKGAQTSSKLGHTMDKIANNGPCHLRAILSGLGKIA